MQLINQLYQLVKTLSW